MTEQQLSDIQQKAHEAGVSVSKYLIPHALISSKPSTPSRKTRRTRRYKQSRWRSTVSV
ncbi:hypothetical protein [Bifidobacterium boum]|uniref:hypothetical protein n=1 Tax=Bifidobacterium boum TaxID=78343 RepID=UPI003B968EA6